MPLPIVDLSPFLTSSSPRSLKLAAAAALNDACCTHGFFYLSHHNIPSTLQSSILETAHTFFRDTADVQKNKLQRLNPGKGGDGARGYQRLGENVTQGKSDFHEALDFYRPVDPLIPYSADPSTGWRLLHGPNIWPQEPVQFQPLFEEYFSRLRQLGDAVIVAMAWALGYQDDDEEELLRSTRDGFWVARVIGYPPLGNNESSGGNQDGGVSCGVHTDYGCTTFLLADDTPGALQVLSKSGVWINADPIEDCYVVNIGDMMQVWTNGLWTSTKHRVIHKDGGYRVSVPFFYEPNWDAVVKPLEKCVEITGGKALYKETLYGEHLTSKVAGNFYSAGNGK